AERMLYAYEFAYADPYRAATHNKGIMNGIDAVAVATGQDWRGIESGAHAYACRDGAYRSLTTCDIADGHLHGTIELPMAVSTVGRVAEAHPRVRLALRMLGVASARELSGVMAAVGLASNMAAMRALATEGIQKGHMALHARAVTHAAGARGADVERLREPLLPDGEVKPARARELLRTLETRSRAARPPAGRGRERRGRGGAGGSGARHGAGGRQGHPPRRACRGLRQGGGGDRTPDRARGRGDGGRRSGRSERRSRAHGRPAAARARRPGS